MIKNISRNADLWRISIVYAKVTLREKEAFVLFEINFFVWASEDVEELERREVKQDEFQSSRDLV